MVSQDSPGSPRGALSFITPLKPTNAQEPPGVVPILPGFLHDHLYRTAPGFPRIPPGVGQGSPEGRRG